MAPGGLRYFPTLMAKKTLHDLDPESLAGRLVVVRVDYNVPLDDEGRVADRTRLDRTLPTIRHLVHNGARVVLLSHLGRPDGRPDPSLSLRGVASELQSSLGSPVHFSPATTGPEARQAVDEVVDGGVLLLENTRFHSEDTENDRAWAEELRHGATLFVNDAFGTAHRAQASTTGVARAVRDAGGEAVAGYLIEAELRFLGDALVEPEHPFVAVIGGAKISGKIDVIEALLPTVDRLLIGGAIANTFFLALGLEVGESLVEPDRVEVARDLMSRAGEKILLPVDVVTAPELVAGAVTRSVDRTDVSPTDRIGDIGPASVRLFADEVSGARTVVWNGPMGMFEVAEFGAGTAELAQVAARAADTGATVVLGGGDSAAAAEAAGVASRMTHVSTGGGAALEFLSGSELPGVEALSDRVSEDQGEDQ